MCGIFGHVGSLNSFQISFHGLRYLEYRGYDSAGIAGLSDNEILCLKKEGTLDHLKKILPSDLESNISVAHTRWATHGVANTLNAHPHLDSENTLAIVHNGILENHLALRHQLEKKGRVFVTDTDSEVIAQLIAHHYDGDLASAIRKSLEMMRGFWAIGILHKDYPDTLFATKRESPLVLALAKDKTEGFISSDPHAFPRADLDVFFLENDELALIRKDKISILNSKPGSRSNQAESALDLSTISFDKGDFEHFMLKEIFEQPDSIKSTIHNRYNLATGDIFFDESFIDQRKFSKVLFLGCGSSWHAGLIAALQIEALGKVSAWAEISSEFRYKSTPLSPDTLVVAISQSGETFDTIAAMRKAKEAGVQTLAICNSPGSTIMREADHVLSLRAGPEISVCSTKAFNCQLTLLSLLSLKIGVQKNLDRHDARILLSDIHSAPCCVQEVLEMEESFVHLASKYALLPNFLFIGRQYMYPTALEAALKLKEISYLAAFACPAGELKHGPLALVDQNCLTIALCGNHLTQGKMINNLREIKAREGKILAFASTSSEELEEIADDVLYLPLLSDPIAPIPYSIATQLFAYYIAKNRGREIDKPRNLAKSVTVE